MYVILNICDKLQLVRKTDAIDANIGDPLIIY